MSMYTKGIVASGHKLVSSLAAEVIKAGGNAFDGIVAAGFAAAIAEPALTSLGGGGFLLGHSTKDAQNLFFDFFVDTPGLGVDKDPSELHFYPITVSFSGSDQEFNVGLGSVAVPGNLKGLLHVHDRLGYMDLGDVLAPAQELAKSHILNEQQAHFLQLLYPIMTMSETGRNLYEPDGQYLKAGSPLQNNTFSEFLGQLAEDRGESFYYGEIAQKIDRNMRERGGMLSAEDLARYQVHERSPLEIPYRDHLLLTSPQPSMGGTLIGLSISLLEKLGPFAGEWGESGQLQRTVGLMQEVEKLRSRGITTPEALEDFLHNGELIDTHLQPIRMFSRGTTHISIADKDGNCASMTCSNGEGSGYFAPDTGIMLNNMMGEDDLHPDGFHTSPPGMRVGSMMSPSLLMKGDRVRLVIGSGGSKRIRTAVSQVLSQVVDFSRSLEEAIQAPRMYWDGEIVQVEPGFTPQATADLKSHVQVNIWPQYDVYFGGVHAVIPGELGVGDPRRGGAVSIVTKEGME
ncbi:MAG: gamma-glutamyltransferase [Desulfobulbaceae bacterium]|nr:MAG: gamma-glutamyltransferase [Desulfobulbaceae bacterium]